jgi:hypothetical protein
MHLAQSSGEVWGKNVFSSEKRVCTKYDENAFSSRNALTHDELCLGRRLGIDRILGSEVC